MAGARFRTLGNHLGMILRQTITALMQAPLTFLSFFPMESRESGSGRGHARAWGFVGRGGTSIA
jgi:hypothetical protein